MGATDLGLAFNGDWDARFEDYANNSKTPACEKDAGI